MNIDIVVVFSFLAGFWYFIYLAIQKKKELRQNVNYPSFTERKITDCQTLTELAEYRNTNIDERATEADYLKEFAEKFPYPPTNVLFGNMAYLCLHAPEPYRKQMRLLLSTMIEERKLNIKLDDL
jgi:hypothetical protein